MILLKNDPRLLYSFTVIFGEQYKELLINAKATPNWILADKQQQRI